MDSKEPQNTELTPEPEGEGSKTGVSQQARRRFGRNVVAGSAVLLTLSNRSAWGDVGPADNQCLSASVLLSYSPNAPSTMARHYDEVEAYKRFEFLEDQYDVISQKNFDPQRDTIEEVAYLEGGTAKTCWTIINEET